MRPAIQLRLFPSAERRRIVDPSMTDAIHEVVIEKLVAGGDGLARAAGKVLFVPFTLPGERVRVEVAASRKGYSIARLVEVREASPHRVSPPCPVFGVCGGCAWQHIDYPEQARLKVGLAGEALARIGRLAPPALPIVPSAPYAYRNRVQLHRDREGRIGFLKRASHEVVPIGGCPISVPPINALLSGPVAGILPAAGKRFTVFAVGDQVAIEGLSSAGRRFTVFAAEDWVAVEGLSPGAAGGSPGAGSSPATPRLAGAGPLAVRILDREIRFGVEAFFQSNLGLLPELVRYALAGLSGRTALDLYCGVGLFGSFLAGAFERVVAVEASPAALGYARGNLPGRGHSLYASGLEDWVRSPPPLGDVDAVVVDPPRTGLSPAVSRWLAGLGAERLVYVSCDIVTLARDLSRLLAGGYRLEQMRLFDFYPQTAHLEAVARMRAARAGPAPSRQSHNRASGTPVP
jgi:23S rRNA (uracil1939-C5)-methyltransferase